MAYTGIIDLNDGLRPRNNGTFPLVAAKDVYVEVNQRLQDLIPTQATSANKLADKGFVNSSIATNTATFRGTYNLVSDLGLTKEATEEQTAAAIATHLAGLTPPIVPENNDYCFVQIPSSDATPTEISRIDRYKCTVTESGGVESSSWEYEFSLNNSSFTSEQWAAINSGITAELVSKLSGLPDTLVTSVNGKTGPTVSLSASDVGAVDKTGDTMTGQLQVVIPSSTPPKPFQSTGVLVQNLRDGQVTNKTVYAPGCIVVIPGDGSAAKVFDLPARSGTIALQGEESFEETIYAELKRTKDGGELVPGKQYRITDYVATVANVQNARSANHSFDIIVTADTTNKLNEVAKAVQHSGDTYFSSCKLQAWEVWYCIDNDTSRFAWADDTNGKGVVYRLVDEWGNECPFDFKGIQFKAYGDTDNVFRYTFDSGAASDNADISLQGQTNRTYGNKIKNYNDPINGKAELPAIVFKGIGSNSNSFGPGCRDITFGAGCYCNTFGNYCYVISIGNDCADNTFGNDCTNIRFGTQSAANDSYQFIAVESGNRYIELNCTASGGTYRNVKIAQGVNNTTNWKTITDSNVNQTFLTTYKPRNSVDVEV